MLSQVIDNPVGENDDIFREVIGTALLGVDIGLLDDVIADLVKQLLEQVILVCKIEIEGALGDLCALCDLADAGF